MWGSGFVTQIIYAIGGSIVDNSKNLLTENNLDIMTESSQNIDTEQSFNYKDV